MIKCVFDKEYAKAVFNVIPMADFIIADTDSKVCYWGTAPFAPDITDISSITEFFTSHDTYLGFVDIPDGKFIIWRSEV